MLRNPEKLAAEYGRPSVFRHVRAHFVVRQTPVDSGLQWDSNQLPRTTRTLKTSTTNPLLPL